MREVAANAREAQKRVKDANNDNSELNQVSPQVILSNQPSDSYETADSGNIETAQGPSNVGNSEGRQQIIGTSEAH